MSQNKLVIVESPTKAKLISSFLPSDFETVATLGHIRDLPTNKKQIPEKYKKAEMSALGVLSNSFTPIYVVSPEKKKVVETLKQKVKNSNTLYIATDEDREGESIGWHIIDELNLKKEIKRLTFHEISKAAILNALKSPREIDLSLVKAQEARRVLDRLYGYLISPILWKKISKGLSAGRVQSVALRLLVEREEERLKFKSASYWSLSVEFQKDGITFSAKLDKINGQNVASSKDFNPETGKLETNAILLTEDQVNHILEEIKSFTPRVTWIDSRDVTLKSPSPYITSSLQQEANRKFGFSPKYTMNLAQKLYENGYITYMRTDSVNLSQEAIKVIRDLILSNFGNEYLPESPKKYKSSVKNAQEAHEAIRPVFSQELSVGEIEKKLGKDASKLFDLIFKRTLASQMVDAVARRTSIKISAGPYEFRASGKVISFPGYLKIFDSDLNEEILPDLKIDESLMVKDFKSSMKTTNPPSRFTEGALVRELEKRGIGRPSTWASIVDLVTRKEYAFKKNGFLIPTFLSFVIVRLLREYFPELIDYEFTARMEDQLDKIAKGEVSYESFLNEFYYGSSEMPGLRELIDERFPKIDSRKICTIPIAQDVDKQFYVRVGKNSVSLTDGERYAGISLNTAPDELKPEVCKAILFGEGISDQEGKLISEKYGKYGRYLEIKEGETTKRISLQWLGNKVLDDQTKNIISQLPKSLGYSEYFKSDITLNVGQYGPYLAVNNTFKSIPVEKISTINLQEAEVILKQVEANTRVLGVDSQGEAVIVKKGRFGFYLKKGTKKVKIKDPNLDFEKALSILETSSN